MYEYGVTPTGVAIKRFDEIMNELHDDLSKGWGVNTRLNPQSYLVVQLTAYADKVAGLWEFGEQIYHSMYPFSAFGISLDNAVQFGGISREEARPTIYPIHAECIEGATIPTGTTIKTDTNPAVEFTIAIETKVTRNSFNAAKIRLAVVQKSSVYTVVLNGTVYTYTSEADATETSILNGLMAAILNTDFTVSVSGNVLNVISVDSQKLSQLVLSSNLTTVSVTAIVNFESVESGEVNLPNDTITEIATTVTGLLSVVNRLPYIAGRHLQTDIELRQSYAEKIYARASRMIESIRSAILLNVQGVTSVAGYQNDTNIVDLYGRWPHCVEMVVDGGNDYEIALQIWDKKTDGIQTFGSTEVEIAGDEGEPMIIRFNRPDYVYMWFNVAITMSGTEPLPPNYAEAISNIIINEMATVSPGKPIIPQRLIESKIYGMVPGISFIETKTFYTENPNEPPTVFSPGIIPITPRQRAVTDDARIEVVLNG